MLMIIKNFILSVKNNQKSINSIRIKKKTKNSINYSNHLNLLFFKRLLKMDEKSKKRRQNSRSKSSIHSKPLTKDELSQLLKTDFRTQIIEITDSAKANFLSQIHDQLNIYVQNIVENSKEEAKAKEKAKIKPKQRNPIDFSDQDVNLSSDHNNKQSFFQPLDSFRLDNIDLTNEEEKFEDDFLSNNISKVNDTNKLSRGNSNNFQETIPINPQAPMNSQDSHEEDDQQFIPSNQVPNDEILLTDLYFEEEEEMLIMDDPPQIMNSKPQANSLNIQHNISPINSNSDSNSFPNIQDSNEILDANVKLSDDDNFNTFHLRKFSGNNSSHDSDLQIDDI